MRINYMANISAYRLAYSFNKKTNKVDYTKKEEFDKTLNEMRRDIRERFRRADEIDINPKALEANEITEDFEIPEGAVLNPWQGDFLGMNTKEALQKFESNLSNLSEFSLKSSRDVKDSIDQMASLYTVFKKHVSQNGTNDDLKQLEDIFEKHVDKYAKGYSEEVGTFFEKNGMEDEVKHLNYAVKKRIYATAKDYDKFITAKPNVGYVEKDDELDKDIELASKLIDTYRKTGNGETISMLDSYDYTSTHLAELVDMVTLGIEIDSIGTKSHVSDKDIGTQLGRIKIKAQQMLDSTFFMGAHEIMFNKFVDTHVGKLIDTYEDERNVSSDYSNKDRKPIDRDYINSIMREMQSSYNDLFTRVLFNRVHNKGEFDLGKFAQENSDWGRTYGSLDFWNSVTQDLANEYGVWKPGFSRQAFDVRA